MSDTEERPNKRLKRADGSDDDDDSGSDEDDGGAVGPGGKKKTGKGGSSCHQCKSRRNFTALTYCTSNLDKKNKRCRKKFCGHCLKKFYKEHVAQIANKDDWKCPSCRKICCCAACRRRKNKEGAKDTSGDGSASHKAKKASSKQRREREEGGHGYGHGHGGHRYTEDGYGAGVTNEEGYPVPSTHRRGDRSLLHSSHSPRMGGLMSDSMGGGLPHPYDLEGAEGHSRRQSRGHGGQSDYSESEGSHAYSSSSDDSASDSDEDGRRANAGGAGTGHGHGHGNTLPPSAEYGSGDDAPSLPSSHFTALLSNHIKSLAEESSRDANSPFARLYRQAQASKVRKKIKGILVRADLKKEKKVELIAALLLAVQQEAEQQQQRQLHLEAQQLDPRQVQQAQFVHMQQQHAAAAAGGGMTQA